MDREIYTLKVYSTRMEYDSFQLELTPKENEEARILMSRYGAGGRCAPSSGASSMTRILSTPAAWIFSMPRIPSEGRK